MQTTTTPKLKILTGFSLATLLIGISTAYLSFALFPYDSSHRLPDIYPPQWVFWAVWMVLYPAMGWAAGHVWLKRHEYDVRGAMTFYVSMLLGNLMFLPIANLSKGNPAIMTFMDINGVLTSVLLGWLFGRYSKTAFLFTLPLIIWMPITTCLKIVLWIYNPIG
ncbi:MAG: TspO/MBR family protein [Chitinophagaceae bacterium]